MSAGSVAVFPTNNQRNRNILDVGSMKLRRLMLDRDLHGHGCLKSPGAPEACLLQKEPEMCTLSRSSLNI